MRHHCRILLALAIAADLAAAGAEPPVDQANIRMVPSAPEAAERQLMRRWHRDVSGRISPVLREWESLDRAARERPGSGLTAGCRRLGLALGRLEGGRLPLAPDPSISLHLEETLRSLADAADSCTHGAYFLTAWRLREADSSWRELRGRLLLYGLEP